MSSSRMAGTGSARTLRIKLRTLDFNPIALGSYGGFELKVVM